MGMLLGHAAGAAGAPCHPVHPNPPWTWHNPPCWVLYPHRAVLCCTALQVKLGLEQYEQRPNAPAAAPAGRRRGGGPLREAADMKQVRGRLRARSTRTWGALPGDFLGCFMLGHLLGCGRLVTVLTSA